MVCPRTDADAFFAPLIANFSLSVEDDLTISQDDFSVILIDGEGLEAGQRVLELTSPLAIAGISILFITSYYADYILVPFAARAKVIRALEDRGFVFEADTNGEDGGHMVNPASPLLQSHHRHQSSTSSTASSPINGTPPPASVSDLQIKTFKMLKRNNIEPHVDKNIELVTCAGTKDTTASSAGLNFTEGKLQLGLLKCLTTMPTPRFLSLTLTDTESVSVTMEKQLLRLFHHDGEDLLLGKDGPEQIAITLDLATLPQESTGIVCGVASRLLDGMRGRISQDVFNMAYLSTARAGHVIVYEDELDDVMEALRGPEPNGFHEVQATTSGSKD